MAERAEAVVGTRAAVVAYIIVHKRLKLAVIRAEDPARQGGRWRRTALDPRRSLIEGRGGGVGAAYGLHDVTPRVARPVVVAAADLALHVGTAREAIIIACTRGADGQQRRWTRRRRRRRRQRRRAWRGWRHRRHGRGDGRRQPRRRRGWRGRCRRRQSKNLLDPTFVEACACVHARSIHLGAAYAPADDANDDGACWRRLDKEWPARVAGARVLFTARYVARAQHPRRDGMPKRVIEACALRVREQR